MFFERRGPTNCFGKWGASVCLLTNLESPRAHCKNRLFVAGPSFPSVFQQVGVLICSADWRPDGRTTDCNTRHGSSPRHGLHTHTRCAHKTLAAAVNSKLAHRHRWNSSYSRKLRAGLQAIAPPVPLHKDHAHNQCVQNKTQNFCLPTAW